MLFGLAIMSALSVLSAARALRVAAVSARKS
jgi:hypothetical protein